MYTTVLHIALQHEYYPVGNCPVSLIPTAPTVRLLSRCDILFHKQAANRWLLVSQNGLKSLVEETHVLPLQFTLQATNHTLYYVTSSWKSGPAFTIEATNAPRTWQTITIDVQYLIANKQNEIKIEAQSEEKYMEYLCIPRFNNADIPLRMTEEKQRIQLREDNEKAALPDGTVVRRFITTEKVKLLQNSALQMQLWEIRESGERLIGSAIPCPQPVLSSPISPRDTITKLFYY